MLWEDEDLDMSYLGHRQRISKDQYILAYGIYLEVTDPDNPHNEASVRNEAKIFSSLPDQVRNGCKACPYMRMEITHDQSWCNDYFKIFIPSGLDDGTRLECESIAVKIEDAWRGKGLPVERRWVSIEGEDE